MLPFFTLESFYHIDYNRPYLLEVVNFIDHSGCSLSFCVLLLLRLSPSYREKLFDRL